MKEHTSKGDEAVKADKERSLKVISYNVLSINADELHF